MNRKLCCCPECTDATEIGNLFVSGAYMLTRFPICMSHHHLWLWWDFVWHQNSTSTNPSPQKIKLRFIHSLWAPVAAREPKTQSNRVIHLLSSKMKKFSFQNGSTKCCMIELMLTTQYHKTDLNRNLVNRVNDWHTYIAYAVIPKTA